jgi:hypothetical protein
VPRCLRRDRDADGVLPHRRFANSRRTRCALGRGAVPAHLNRLASCETCPSVDAAARWSGQRAPRAGATQLRGHHGQVQQSEQESFMCETRRSPHRMPRIEWRERSSNSTTSFVNTYEPRRACASPTRKVRERSRLSVRSRGLSLILRANIGRMTRSVSPAGYPDRVEQRRENRTVWEGFRCRAAKVIVAQSVSSNCARRARSGRPDFDIVGKCAPTRTTRSASSATAARSVVPGRA